MRPSARPIVAILVIAALAIGFWMLALGPKREQADELAEQAERIASTLEVARSEVVAATAAKRAFPADYRQMVTLGQAVPGSDETASLLVELEKISKATGVEFTSMQLSGSGEGSAPTTAPTGTAPPTEVAAALLPLGASVGTAGLAVMPYDLSFSGSFFRVADFIERVDSLVEPKGTEIAVDGRLITIDGFSLSADTERGFPHLTASFSVTTYLTPPEQGATAGATASAPSATVPSGSEAPPPTETGTTASETAMTR
jgi:Tfp pilus assembly protein PilO